MPSGRFKLKQEDVDKMRTLRESNPEVYTISMLASMFRVGQGTVCKIVNNKSRTKKVNTDLKTCHFMKEKKKRSKEFAPVY